MQLDTIQSAQCQKVLCYLITALDGFLPVFQLEFAGGRVENAAQDRGLQLFLGTIIV